MGERGARRVLLIDDDSHVRHVYSWMLKELGFHVVDASGSREALALASSQPFDIVIVDWIMPGDMSGPEILATAPCSGIATRVLSGGHDNDPVPSVLSDSGVLRLLKPFRIEDLRSVLGLSNGGEHNLAAPMRVEDHARVEYVPEHEVHLISQTFHDLNNLMTGVLGYLSLVRLAEGPADARDHLASAIQLLGRSREVLRFGLSVVQKQLDGSAPSPADGSGARAELEGQLWALNALVRLIPRVIGFLHDADTRAAEAQTPDSFSRASAALDRTVQILGAGHWLCKRRTLVLSPTNVLRIAQAVAASNALPLEFVPITHPLMVGFPEEELQSILRVLSFASCIGEATSMVCGEDGRRVSVTLLGAVTRKAFRTAEPCSGRDRQSALGCCQCRILRLAGAEIGRGLKRDASNRRHRATLTIRFATAGTIVAPSSVPGGGK